jgi:methyl-accepting chemotaxis protein
VARVADHYRAGQLREAGEADEKVFALEEQVARDLDSFSSKDIAQLVSSSVSAAAAHERTAIAMSAIFSSVALLVGLIVAIIVTRGITRRLKAAVGLADAVSLGDLSGRLEINERDEVGRVGESLNRMVANLKATAGLAESVAVGDLSTDAKLLSEKDVLGRAIETMIQSLRGRAELADRIANGDLGVEVKLL